MKLLTLVAVCLSLVRLGGQMKKYQDLQDQAQGLEKELQQVQEEYQAKQTQIELLNDNAYIERLARERLGMVKAGETLVMPVDPEKEVIAAAPASEDVPME